MKTTILSINKDHPDREKLQQAAHIIKTGGLVAFPTETVYGLGANALDGSAVKKIFMAKGRPSDNPLIVHVSSRDMVLPLVASMPAKAERLMDTFWPGPLTIVLRKSRLVPRETTAGLRTVAVRMPVHPVALGLIEAANTPIAAPSANISGRPSPTKAEHVIADLKGRIALILANGPCEIGLESTVIDLTGSTPLILRPGKITVEQVARVIGKVEIYKPKKNEGKVKSPGMKYTHYAPEAKVIVVKGSQQGMDLEVRRLKRIFVSRKKKVAIIYTKALTKFAKDLFSRFRTYDKQGYDIIIVQAVPAERLGLAIMNRLEKAATEIIHLQKDKKKEK